MKLLYLGDVVGRSGREAANRYIAHARSQLGVEFVVVNGENAAAGFGITPAIAREFFDAGADVVTTGNHAWDQLEIIPYLAQEKRLLRPQNYPPSAPGAGAARSWRARQAAKAGWRCKSPSVRSAAGRFASRPA